MKKRMISLLLTWILVMISLPARADTAESPDSSAAEIILALENGIIPDSMIGDDLTHGLTHAELAALAVRLFEAFYQTQEQACPTPFGDITGHKLQTEIEKACGLGLMPEIEGDRFLPDTLVSRQYTALVLCRVLKAWLYEDWTSDTDREIFLEYSPDFVFHDDGDISGNALDSVYFLASNGLMNGMNSALFCPEEIVSRASAIIAAGRIYLRYRDMDAYEGESSGEAGTVSEGSSKRTDMESEESAGQTDTVSEGSSKRTDMESEESAWQADTVSEGSSEQTGNETGEPSGQITRPPEFVTAVKKLSGYYKRFGLVREDGSLWTWGEKYLGNGEQVGGSRPVHIMDDVDTVYMGMDASLAVKTDGTLWAWGNNYGNTIGNGQDGGEQLTPVMILEHVVTASMGFYTAAAVTEDGGLYIWGYNYDGNLGSNIPQLGGSVKKYLSPTRVMENVAEVSCNNANYGAFTMVLKRDGTLWTFGDDQFGQLGDGRTDLGNQYWELKDGGTFGRKPFEWEPRQIMDHVVSIHAADRMGTAILSDGTLWTWGFNKYGRLGNGGAFNAEADDGNHVPCQTCPLQIMDNVAAVREGYELQTAILKKDGTVWMCGKGYSEVPVQVDIGSVVSIALSNTDTYALKADGTLWKWGIGSYDPVQMTLVFEGE